MSESVTNAEVEDVLSSIRRLVGENKKPKTGASLSDAPDRLVLTPQLRVSDHDVLHLGPDAAVSSPEDWYEFEEPPLPDGSDMRFGSAADEGPEEGEAQDNDGAVAHEALSDMSETSEEPAPHEQAPSDGSESQSSDAPDGGEPSAAQRPDYSELTAKIAALETAIARTKDQWEPDGEGRDAYAGTRAPAMMWRDNIELDARGKPLDSGQPGSNDYTVSKSESEATGEIEVEEEVIDENMLRDLVSEIVRSELAGDVVANAVRAELQGDLGARITRNIRKLVRREIRLALASQSLE